MYHTLGAVKNAIGIGADEPELRIETERKLVRDCHRIITTTEREKDDLVLYYGAIPEKISVIPCGVNLDLFRPMDQKIAKRQLGFGDDKIVLFVGRIELLKGVDRLLGAMTSLPDGWGVRLVIIGGDENSRNEVERLRHLSKELRIQDSVTFLGLIQQERLPWFYSAADVCVVPSYYESFGLVALESLACGTPVVAANVGELKSIIRQGKTGYVVTDNASHHLADKIALLLSLPGSKMEPALAIRASVTRFGWSNIAHEIIETCEGVVAGYFTLVH
jgi:D-inositol-3-phosphate glycosyltransferase